MLRAGRSVPWGSVYLDAHAEGEGEGGDEVYRKTGYFLAWSMLEGPCLCALCTVMLMLSKKGREGRSVSKPGYFLNDQCWKGRVFGLCVPLWICRMSEKMAKRVIVLHDPC
jgi:hypothetical protein